MYKTDLRVRQSYNDVSMLYDLSDSKDNFVGAASETSGGWDVSLSTRFEPDHYNNTSHHETLGQLLTAVVAHINTREYLAYC